MFQLSSEMQQHLNVLQSVRLQTQAQQNPFENPFAGTLSQANNQEDPEEVEARQRRKRPPSSYRKCFENDVPGYSQDSTAEEVLF